MLHERLKQARQLKGLTQEQLAELVHTKKGTISNYENRHSTPSNEMLVELANVLDVTTDYLLGRDIAVIENVINPDQLKWLQFGNELKKNGFNLDEIVSVINNIINIKRIKN